MLPFVLGQSEHLSFVSRQPRAPGEACRQATKPLLFLPAGSSGIYCLCMWRFYFSSSLGLQLLLPPASRLSGSGRGSSHSTSRRTPSGRSDGEWEGGHRTGESSRSRAPRRLSQGAPGLKHHAKLSGGHLPRCLGLGPRSRPLTGSPPSPGASWFRSA